MKMTSLFKILTAAGVSAGLAAAGFAADSDDKPAKAEAGKGRPGAQPGAFFAHLDKDGDGKITEAEAPSPEAWEKLSKLDKDGDGAVSKSELPQAPADGDRPGAGSGAGMKMIAGFLKRLDTDADGKVSKAEAGERWERLSNLDKDGDEAISLATELPQAPAGGSPGEFFARADKNGDEKLTEDEVSAEAWARLSNLDKNGDGAVGKDELAAARDGLGGGAGPGAGAKGGGGVKPNRPEGDENAGKTPKRPEPDDAS